MYSTVVRLRIFPFLLFVYILDTSFYLEVRTCSSTSNACVLWLAPPAAETATNCEVGPQCGTVYGHGHLGLQMYDCRMVPDIFCDIFMLYNDCHLSYFYPKMPMRIIYFLRYGKHIKKN